MTNHDKVTKEKNIPSSIEEKSTIETEAKHASYYLIIGLTAMALDMSIFYLLNKQLGITAVLANTMSVIIAIIFGFFGNQRYNFKIKDNLLKRFISYASVNLTGLLLGNIFIYTTNSVYGLDALLAKIISMPFIIGAQYTVNRLTSFNKKRFNSKS